MTEPNTEPSDAEKIRTLITHDALAHLDSNLLHELLTTGDPESGVEPVEGDARDVVDDWLHNDWKDSRTERLWSNHPSIINALERLALHGVEENISQSEETGGLGSYLRVVRRQAYTLPDWLAPRLIESELDRAEAATFDSPEDWQRLIGLLQIEREDLAYPEGRDDTDNYDDRKQAWDELLKFTKYHAKVTYTLGDGKTSLAAEGWAQSDATIHNRAVRRVPDEAEVERVETAPIERYQPGEMQDPLPDLEGFVFYEVER